MAAIMNDLPQMRAASGSRPTRPVDCAIDLVHLSRQTLGDRGLEFELLGLFQRQCAQIVARLEAGSTERQARRDLAHTLKGSALAVGAGAVAAAANRYEQALAGDEQAAVEAALDALSLAAGEARAAVAMLLTEA